MNTRSLKFRLVAWYAGWLTVLFVVFGLFVYESLGHYLNRSLREALARRVRQVADAVQRSSSKDPESLAHEIQSYFAPEVNSRFTRVTRDGVITYVAGPPADGSFDPQIVPPAPPQKHGEETFGPRTLPDGTVLLIVVLSRTANGIQYVIEEGSAEEPIETTLHAWLTALVLGLALLIVVSIGGGFVLVQRALEPVDRIISSAERISSRNLSERLAIPNTRDEFERLSTALNNMIRRLDEGFQHTQRFLADASHELRTPLTIMQGELEAVVERTDRPDVRDIAGSALEEVERLKKIVEGLFALTRLDAGEAQTQSVAFNLGDLAETTADQMCLLAEDKEISITCRSPQKVIVEGDRARLKQVMVNLLDNAIKYTPSGGKIDVTVTARERTAVLEVSDNGIGIPSDALPHVFERFFRVDKARSRELGGAGLGLSIVKAICVAHGGSVEVRSKDGEGSRFIVELPLGNGVLLRT